MRDKISDGQILRRKESERLKRIYDKAALEALSWRALIAVAEEALFSVNISVLSSKCQQTRK